MPTLFVVEAVGEIDPVAYRRTLNNLLGQIGRLDDTAERAMLAVLDESRRSILASLAALESDSPSAAMYRAALAGVNTATANLADTMGRTIEDYQRQGFELGVRLALDPLETAGFRTLTNVVTTNQLQVLAGFSTDLVRGVADDVRRRATLEVTAVTVGAKTPAQAAAAIGSRINRGVFSTVGHRARAIVVTEVGRAQALATQAAQAQLAERVPGVRKRWINSHLPGSRETHLEAEARYAPDGEIGPIPIDAEFEVAGFRALYPRDPSLPASESVHCKCVSITVIDDATTTSPAGPAALDATPTTTPPTDDEPVVDPAVVPNPRDSDGYREQWDHNLRWIQDDLANSYIGESLASNGLTVDDLPAIRDTWNDLIDRHPLTVEVDSYTLESIIRDGRIKSQFETGRSTAIFDPEGRAEIESSAFGAAADLADELRPIYGAITDRPGSAGYGNVSIRLKDELKTRSTFYMGDSILGQDRFGLQPPPVGWRYGEFDPVVNLNWNYLRGGFGVANDLLHKARPSKAPGRNNYLESQTWGGVSIDDIESITFIGTDPPPGVAQLLDDAGIPWKRKARPR